MMRNISMIMGVILGTLSASVDNIHTLGETVNGGKKSRGKKYAPLKGDREKAKPQSEALKRILRNKGRK